MYIYHILFIVYIYIYIHTHTYDLLMSTNISEKKINLCSLGNYVCSFCPYISSHKFKVDICLYI